MKTYFKINIILLSLCLGCKVLSAQEACNQAFTQGVDVSPLVIPYPTEFPTTDGVIPNGYEDSLSYGGERIIYWVHGLAGTQESWARASAATSVYGAPDFPVRKVFSLNPEYTEFSLNSAAWNLHQNCVTLGDPVDQAIGNPDPLNNFIIAHSQGGLVSRALDKLYADNNLENQRRIGGVVTFGTAHQGAQILNNFDDILDYADLVCTELTAGPLLEEILSNFWLDFLLDEDAVLETADVACDFFSQNILPIALTSFQPTITEEYKVGSPELFQLNAYESTIPMVAFYGVEEEPLLWRNLQYLGIDNPNDYDPFEANTDDKLVENANSNAANYFAKYMHWEMVKSDLADWGMPCDAWDWTYNFILCTILDNKYWKADALTKAWIRGYDWFVNANREYKLMIGAIDYEYYSQLYCGCFPQDDDWVDPFNNDYYAVSSVDECPDNCWTETVMESHEVHHESDGVVLANSAAGLPHADFIEKLDKTSHMQMRNSETLKQALNRLFNGEFGLYFKTEER